MNKGQKVTRAHAKAKRVFEMLAKYPNLSNGKIAKKADCSAGYVWLLRKQGGIGGQLTLPLAPKEKVVRLVQPDPRIRSTHDEISNLLAQRGEEYGNFMANADITIKIKQILHRRIADRGLNLFPDQLHAMDMIATKLARIVNGNYNNVDSWKDIAGYAKLVVDRLESKRK